MTGQFTPYSESQNVQKVLIENVIPVFFPLLCMLSACSGCVHGAGKDIVADADQQECDVAAKPDISADIGDVSVDETLDMDWFWTEADIESVSDTSLSDKGAEESVSPDTDVDAGDCGGYDIDYSDTAGDPGYDTGETETKFSLKIWTFNLLNPSNPLAKGADVKLRTQIVIDAIKKEQPDLIAFQEVVDSSSIPNRAAFIAEATGYSWAWQQEYTLLLYDEGIAILSKWPILETESHELPHKDLALFTRYVLRVRVDTPAENTDFYCSHFIAFGIENQSADQALTAFEFINKSSVGLPSFFAGDLNAGPDTIYMRFLRGKESYKGVIGNFTDAWLAANPGDPGLTVESDKPYDRIDYIYIVPSAPFPTVATDCKLIFDEPVDSVYASDHIGVSCNVSLSLQ
jgi:endonuclease/exonuclease/phosphatase family metal-dependent hydrolase